MEVNIFGPAKDYPSMLNKLGLFTFFYWLCAIWLLCYHIPSVRLALGGAVVAKIPETDVSIPVGGFLLALLLAIVCRAVKLHDRLSDLFGIRARFDYCAILLPIAVSVGLTLSMDRQEELRKRRKSFMGEVFYKYVSSSAGHASIDPHVITMALDQWFWYWTFLELNAIIVITAVVAAIFGLWIFTACGLVLCLSIIWFMQLLRRFCEKYAADEIKLITQEETRAKEIRGSFDALFSTVAARQK